MERRESDWSSIEKYVARKGSTWSSMSRMGQGKGSCGTTLNNTWQGKRGVEQHGAAYGKEDVCVQQH